MSLDDLTQAWDRSLAQAAELARAAATEDAVAKSLAVYRATTDAVVRANPPDRLVIHEYVVRSRDELDRIRTLHAATRVAARSYEAERLATVAVPGRDSTSPERR